MSERCSDCGRPVWSDDGDLLVNCFSSGDANCELFCRLAESQRGLASWEALAHHRCAGYRMLFDALGDDGADGYHFASERRDGAYVEVKAPDVTAAAIDLAVKLGMLDADAGGAVKGSL
jgi:hypothetical protein